MNQEDWCVLEQEDDEKGKTDLDEITPQWLISTYVNKSEVLGTVLLTIMIVVMISWYLFQCDAMIIHPIFMSYPHKCIIGLLRIFIVGDDLNWWALDIYPERYDDKKVSKTIEEDHDI